MPQLKSSIQLDLAHEFLTRSFTPGETLAVLLRDEDSCKTQQRIVRFECAIAPRYLRWLAYEKHPGSECLSGRQSVALWQPEAYQRVHR